MRRILAFLLILSCCAFVAAAEPEERTVLAAQLIELMQVSSAANRGLAQPCNPSADALTKRLTERYHHDPGSFSGISPQSVYWPEVERLWREFYVAQCAEAPDDSPMATMIKTYATQMAVQQLRDAVAFWSSASGRAMHAANEQMSREFQAAAGNTASSEPSKAAIAYRMALDQLKAKYKADPR